MMCALKRKNILIACGLSDKKIVSKISSIIESQYVSQVFLVRRKPLNFKNVICYSPPMWMRKFIVLSELYRCFKIIQLSMRRDIDILIGIHYFYHCIYIWVASVLSGKKMGVMLVANPRSYDKKKFFPILLNRASFIGTRGEISKEYIIEKYNIKKNCIFVPPNVMRFSKKPYVDDVKDIDIVFVGTLVQEKRLDILIRVISDLKKQCSSLKVKMIGYGPFEKRLRSWIMEEGLEDTIEVETKSQDIMKEIRRSKILLLTSGTEGMPMVMLEAMSVGVPCVVSDVGDIRDIAEHKKNAWVVPSLQVSDFVEGCVALLTDEILYKEISREAYETINVYRDQCSLKAVTDQWNSVFETLLEKKESSTKV